MNSFKFFGLKRTRPIRYGRELDIFCPVEDFFDPDNYREHSPEASGLRKEKKTGPNVKKTADSCF